MTERRSLTSSALFLPALLLLVLILDAGCTGQPRAGGAHEASGPVEAGGIAFVGVDVIPMTEPGLVLRDQTVLVQKDRIVAVGPRGSVAVPGQAFVIQGQGRYLMPGLIDAHVHLEYFEDPAVLLRFAAYGVTTVRNMDGRPYILDWKRKVASGELSGVSIHTAGPILDGDPPVRDDNTVVRNADEARAAVAAQAAAGYDFIKVYTNLSPEAWAAVLAAARQHGLPVAGHVPRGVRLEQALAAGQTIEHLDGYDDLIEADDSLFRDRWHWSKLYLAMPVDPEKVRDAARRTAAAGVWNVPTLVQKEKVAPLQVMVTWLERPEVKDLGEEARTAWDPRTWDPRRRRLVEEADPEDFRLLAEGRRHRLQLVSALHEAGAGLLAGTDTPNPFVVPGYSLHEELQLFVEAGLSPAAALAAATRDAARFLGESDEIGTIEPGKRADLLLLEGNPLDDLASLERRTGVLLRGVWLPTAELWQRLGRPDAARGEEAPPSSQERGWDTAILGEVSAGAPQKLSASLGFYVGRSTINPYGGTGFVLSAEPGLGGGKVSAGYGAVTLYGHSLVRATILRTWGHPWHADPGKTYIGLEGQTVVYPIPNSLVRAGIFRNGDGWLVSWSLGWSGFGF